MYGYKYYAVLYVDFLCYFNFETTNKHFKNYEKIKILKLLCYAVMRFSGCTSMTESKLRVR